jgi:hypothetical protein
MGCWAEHEDGSLIFVESSEANRVIYSIFDMSHVPPVEYRDAMPEEGFKKHFTWDPNNKTSVKWTWHDKTPFPWDRVIKQNVPDGVKYAFAGHLLSAAERVATSQKLLGAPVIPEKLNHMVERITKAGHSIIEGIQKAISDIRT